MLSISMQFVSLPVACYITAIILALAKISEAAETITRYEVINDSMTLVSAGGKFKLGFFRPGNSENRYLGIWFNIPTQTIIWVANRNNPLNDSSGVLKIGDDGNLILVGHTESIIWSTNIQNMSSNITIAQLLDSGNLVLRDAKTETYVWQSFDYPSDTLLAGMKFGWNLRTGLNRNLTSWKSADDPSPGDFSFAVDLHELPQTLLRRNSVKLFRGAPWDGLQTSGDRAKLNHVFKTSFINNSEEVYYQYDLYDLNDDLTTLVLTYSGVLQRLIWNNQSLEWFLLTKHPGDPCESYGQCGPNAICTVNDAQVCSCLAGYMPKSSQEWAIPLWSGGGFRKKPLNCPKGEGFIKLKGVEIPDLQQFRTNTNMTLKECRVECLKNCSCTAYAKSNTTGDGRGCLLWYGDLFDIRLFAESAKQNLYIRVTASELDSPKKKQFVLVMVAASVASVLLLLASCIIWKRRTQGTRQDIPSRDEENLELPIFNIDTIAEATNNFSYSNKIGEGGFGPVYKGQLSTGQEIAVKRLSENSKQGPNEFKNEVILIAKLQLRNLVRLLGCCIQGEERMLIYEYMPNGSLSSFIFGQDSTRNSLTWRRCFDIIFGIARGLLYLHQDSRLRIIHRDLKASNVLLDNKMNPKISDFGIARTLGGDQLLARTRTVVGTYGYMSPEYVIDGLISIKSDVFSFGVLVLEIVSSKRNRQFRHPDHDLNLLRHAWKLWIEGKASQLVDQSLEDSFPISEVLKSIQVGLLCVQQHPEDRPTMSSVLLMLDRESAMLPQPKQPGFYTERNSDETNDSLVETQHSTNKITVTLLVGR